MLPLSQPIEVIPYNTAWPAIFSGEAVEIQAVLGRNCQAVYHIGSTSVPGLSAKPRIDICVATYDRKAAIRPLEGLGYAFRGELNIPFRFYFTKQQPPVNLHLYDAGSDEINLHLAFRDYLRKHDEMRDAYATLKTQLLAQEGASERSAYRFSNYTLGKNDFIRHILNISGFDGLTMRRPAHYSEWDAVAQLLGERVQPAENNHYFLLYQGMEAQAAAHLYTPTSVDFIFQSIAGAPSAQMDLRHHIEKWMREQQVVL